MATTRVFTTKKGNSGTMVQAHPEDMSVSPGFAELFARHYPGQNVLSVFNSGLNVKARNLADAPQGEKAHTARWAGWIASQIKAGDEELKERYLQAMLSMASDPSSIQRFYHTVAEEQGEE